MKPHIKRIGRDLKQTCSGSERPRKRTAFLEWGKMWGIALIKIPIHSKRVIWSSTGGGVVIDLYSSSGGSITPKLSTLAYNQYGDSARRGEHFPHTFYMPHIFCMTIEDTNLYHLTSRPVLSIYLIQNIWYMWHVKCMWERFSSPRRVTILNIC